METWYPAAKRLPITTGEFWVNRGEPTTAIVEHITAGNDSRNHLQNVRNSSSVHFLIRDERGKAVVYQFMPIEWGAWGNGVANVSRYTPDWVRQRIQAGKNMNLCTISVEHESPYPMPHPYTDVMIDATIALNKWLISVVPTIKADREHVIGHYQIDGVNRPFCPGGPGGLLFPFDAVVAALQGSPQPEPPPANQTAIEVCHDNTGGFAQYGNPCEVDGAGRVKERTIVLPDVPGAPFQVAFYEKGVIVWRSDMGASRYNSGTWLLDSLVKLGEV
jgi:N-acetyl-anhydromuramyl-L-alanine amidase AmpD